MDHQNSVVHPDYQVQRSRSSGLLKGTNHCAYNIIRAQSDEKQVEAQLAYIIMPLNRHYTL